MHVKEGLKLLFGSVVVYGAIAACASGGTMSPFDTTSGSGSSSGDNGSDGSGSSGASTGDDSGGGGLLDALTNPVPAANADTTQSGSRLKAKYYAGSDGSKQFAGWHDSMLNVDCGFSPASDGTTRCVPSGATTQLFFSDSGCAQALAYIPATGCNSPPYALVTVPASATPGCASYFERVLQVVGAYSGAIYTGTPANCSEQPDGGAIWRATYAFYTVGSEVAPSTFVAATVQTDP